MYLIGVCRCTQGFFIYPSAVSVYGWSCLSVWRSIMITSTRKKFYERCVHTVLLEIPSAAWQEDMGFMLWEFRIRWMVSSNRSLWNRLCFFSFILWILRFDIQYNYPSLCYCECLWDERSHDALQNMLYTHVATSKDLKISSVHVRLFYSRYFSLIALWRLLINKVKNPNGPEKVHVLFGFGYN